MAAVDVRARDEDQGRLVTGRPGDPLGGSRCWPARTASEASRPQPPAAEGRLEFVEKVLTWPSGRRDVGMSPGDGKTPSVDQRAARLFSIGVASGADLWGHAIGTQWSRIEQARDEVLGDLERTDRPGVDLAYVQREWRLRYESYFLLLAIRQLLRTQAACFDITADPILKSARDAFDAANGDAELLRNCFEHLDEYLRDIGHKQKSGDLGAGIMPDVIPSSDGRVVLRFDRISLELGRAAQEARALARTVHLVYSSHIVGVLGDSGTVSLEALRNARQAG